MKLHAVLITLVLSALLATPAIGQKLYRWVDSEGNVHYSDQVPPDEIDKAREELNQMGRVVNRIGMAASDAEIEAMDEEQKRLQQEQQRRLQEIAADQEIEDGYVDEQEIMRQRERKLAGLELSIRNAKTFISTQNESVASINKRKTKVEAAGSKVSDALQSMLEDLQRQVVEQQKVLDAKTVERVEVIAFYDQELANYRAMLKRKELRAADS